MGAGWSDIAAPHRVGECRGSQVRSGTWVRGLQRCIGPERILTLSAHVRDCPGGGQFRRGETVLLKSGKSLVSFDRRVGASRRGQVCVQHQRRQTSYQGKSAAFLQVHCSNDKYSVHHASRSPNSGALPQVGLYFYRLVMLRGKAVTTMQFKQPGVRIERKSVCIPHVLSSLPSPSAPAALPHISRVELTSNKLSRSNQLCNYRPWTFWLRSPTLRLHIGLENVEDLKSDLERGFEAFNATRT